MEAVGKATALVQFLFQRPLTEREASRAEEPDFAIDDFRVELLLSDAARVRWPRLREQFQKFVDQQLAKENEPHRIAHDVAVLRMDLVGLQKRLDGLQSAFLDTLRAVDKVKQYFDDVKAIQEQMRKIATRIERVDSAVVRFVG